MKKTIAICLAAMLVLWAGAFTAVGVLAANAAKGETALHQPDQEVADADTALAMLADGNARYLSGELTAKDTYAADREVLAGGQKPFAAVLACADSRVAPEIYFDTKLGDIFAIRNAGNVADDTVLGSAEYAVEHLNVPLVVVVGHSGCGAVTAAYSGGEYPDALQSILNRIEPACEGAKDVDAAIHNNILGMVQRIQADAVIEEAGARVIGAYYDIQTGEITWLDTGAAEAGAAA